MRNDKEYFYKYYSPHSVKLVLKNCSRKWSNPNELNDPFDTQFNLHISEDNNDLAIIANQKFNQTIRSLLLKISIFCVTETNDNLLMWAHYSLYHTGAVIKFLNFSSLDSTLSVAQKVEYKKEMPIFSGNEINTIGEKETQKKIIDKYTLTKSSDWFYEYEWRAIIYPRLGENTPKIFKFPPEELGAIYLGCKMTDEDRLEIIGIIKEKYPKAEIHQARKHDRKFKLVFDRIY